tara:strand:+ start:1594 stop:1701 length:108 start_codon:yes stop_codon:yes gene_type:complete
MSPSGQEKPQGFSDDVAGKGMSKKRRLFCNERDKG